MHDAPVEEKTPSWPAIVGMALFVGTLTAVLVASAYRYVLHEGFAWGQGAGTAVGPALAFVGLGVAMRRGWKPSSRGRDG